MNAVGSEVKAFVNDNCFVMICKDWTYDTNATSVKNSKYKRVGQQVKGQIFKSTIYQQIPCYKIEIKDVRLRP